MNAVELRWIQRKKFLIFCLSGLTNDTLKQHLKDIDLVWNNLAAFLVGGNMMVGALLFSFEQAKS